MLNQIKDGNVVRIEGILSEIDLKYGELVKPCSILQKR